MKIKNKHKHANLQLVTCVKYMLSLGCTFRLLHVAQHSSSSFIQHVLQKHHLTTTGFHTPHQAKGHVPTPEDTGEFSIRLNKKHECKITISHNLSAQECPKVCRSWNSCLKWFD